MLLAELLRRAGDGDVHRLGEQLRRHGAARELARAGLDGGLQLRAHLVRQLPDDGALLGGELAHLLQHGGQLALFAQVLDAQRLQILGVRRALHRRDGGGANGFQLLLHSFFSFEGFLIT